MCLSPFIFLPFRDCFTPRREGDAKPFFHMLRYSVEINFIPLLSLQLCLCEWAVQEDVKKYHYAATIYP